LSEQPAFTINGCPQPNLSRQPAGFLLSRRRPQFCGLSEFKPKLLLSRPEIYSNPACGSSCCSLHLSVSLNVPIISFLKSDAPPITAKYHRRTRSKLTHCDKGCLHVHNI